MTRIIMTKMAQLTLSEPLYDIGWIIVPFNQ